MWIYEQVTGKLYQDGQYVVTGYSGFESGKNNPAMEDDENVGPIPQGLYLIMGPCNTVAHGPYVLPLVPDDDNEMYGRTGFLIHGDGIHDPGFASHGCIVLPHDVRVKIWTSGDHDLEVVRELN